MEGTNDAIISVAQLRGTPCLLLLLAVVAYVISVRRRT
jgi:hypothetical protein